MISFALSLPCTQCARLGFCQLQRCGLTYRPTGPWIDVWMLLLHLPLYSLAVFALSICAFSAHSCSLFSFRLGSGNNSGARQAPLWLSQAQNAPLNSLTSFETKRNITEGKWESCMGMRLCPTINIPTGSGPFPPACALPINSCFLVPFTRRVGPELINKRTAVGTADEPDLLASTWHRHGMVWALPQAHDPTRKQTIRPPRSPSSMLCRIRRDRRASDRPLHA